MRLKIAPMSAAPVGILVFDQRDGARDGARIAREHALGETGVDHLAQQLPRDDEPLNLARAFADRRQLDVAEVLLGRVVLHEPVAAVNLHAVVGRLDRDLARIELRHRRFERRPPAAILQIRRAIGQQARRFDARRVVGELPLNRLERADRLAERLALLRVAERRLVGALRQADRQRRDADAAGVEHLHRVDEALSFLAEQLIERNAAVVEQHFARVAGAHAELVFLLARASCPACRARR